MTNLFVPVSSVSKYKSVKLQAYAVNLVLSGLLCLFGKVDGSTLFNFWILLYGALVFGNVAQKFIQKDNSNSQDSIVK